MAETHERRSNRITKCFRTQRSTSDPGTVVAEIEHCAHSSLKLSLLVSAEQKTVLHRDAFDWCAGFPGNTRRGSFDTILALPSHFLYRLRPKRYLDEPAATACINAVIVARSAQGQNLPPLFWKTGLVNDQDFGRNARFSSLPCPRITITALQSVTVLLPPRPSGTKKADDPGKTKQKRNPKTHVQAG